MIDIPDAPWIGDYYDKYRNRYFGLVSDEEMSLLWDYEPDRCDDHYCCKECDICEYRSELEEVETDE